MCIKHLLLVCGAMATLETPLLRLVYLRKRSCWLCRRCLSSHSKDASRVTSSTSASSVVCSIESDVGAQKQNWCTSFKEYCNRRRFMVSCCGIMLLTFILALSTSLIFVVTAKDVDELLGKLENDPTYTTLIANLTLYAQMRLGSKSAAIRENLARKNLSAIDCIWPGNGFNSAAYLGSYEVLSLLENAGILRVGKIMGASGGASAALLNLVNTSSVTALKSYLAYFMWQEHSWDLQILRLTKLWKELYRRAAQSDAAFKRVKDRAYIVVKCGWAHFQLLPSTKAIDVVFDYATRDQLVEAVQASGESTVLGYTYGVTIDKVSSTLGACVDAPTVTYFPRQSNALLYHNCFYGYAGVCTMEGISYLFKSGVDETINLLLSSDLRHPSNNGNGGMRIILPGPEGVVTEREFSALYQEYPQGLIPFLASDQLFVDVTTGKMSRHM